MPAARRGRTTSATAVGLASGVPGPRAGMRVASGRLRRSRGVIGMGNPRRTAQRRTPVRGSTEVIVLGVKGSLTERTDGAKGSSAP